MLTRKPSQEYYGDSNNLWEHDLSVAHADAALKGVLEAAVVESYVDLLAPNLKVKCVAYLTHFTSARRVTPVAHGTSGQCTDLMVPVPKGTPVLARVGGDDRAVPPWQQRRMFRHLAEHG